MPAAESPAPRRAARRLSALALLLGLLTTVSSVAPDVTQAKPADLTPRISATRGSQLYWEGVMRSADARIRHLAASERHARRSVRRAKTRLRSAIERRAKARQHADGAREALQAARGPAAGAASSGRTGGAPGTAGGSGSLTQAADAGSATGSPGLRTEQATALGQLLQGRSPTSSEVLSPIPPPWMDIVLSIPAPALTSTATSPIPGSTGSAVEAGARPGPPSPQTRSGAAADVLLVRASRKASRQLHRAKTHARRSARTLRRASSRLRASKSARRAAVATRESAERNLGAAILSMSHLGHMRAERKTRQRPALLSGFAMPLRGSLSQGYGCTGVVTNPPRGSCRHFHDGIDIVGYRGAPIRAAAYGVVTYVGWNPWDEQARAFMVVIAHVHGYETLYGHLLPRRVVRVGQEVRGGEIIGYVGSTGKSTGPHLHLELRRGRLTLNPFTVL